MTILELLQAHTPSWLLARGPDVTRMNEPTPKLAPTARNKHLDGCDELLSSLRDIPGNSVVNDTSMAQISKTKHLLTAKEPEQHWDSQMPNI